MVPHLSMLVLLVQLVDRIPAPPPPTHRGRGRPPTYSDRLFLKALVMFDPFASGLTMQGFE